MGRAAGDATSADILDDLTARAAGADAAGQAAWDAITADMADLALEFWMDAMTARVAPDVTPDPIPQALPAAEPPVD